MSARPLFGQFLKFFQNFCRLVISFFKTLKGHYFDEEENLWICAASANRAKIRSWSFSTFWRFGAFGATGDSTGPGPGWRRRLAPARARETVRRGAVFGPGFARADLEIFKISLHEIFNLLKISHFTLLCNEIFSFL